MLPEIEDLLNNSNIIETVHLNVVNHCIVFEKSWQEIVKCNITRFHIRIKLVSKYFIYYEL